MTTPPLPQPPKSGRRFTRSESDLAAEWIEEARQARIEEIEARHRRDEAIRWATSLGASRRQAAAAVGIAVASVHTIVTRGPAPEKVTGEPPPSAGPAKPA